MDIEHDVFLSYNSKDKPLAERLAERLENEGYKIWIDEWNLLPGDNVDKGIFSGIISSRCFLALIGPAGFGPWQEKEVNIAVHRLTDGQQLKIIPVLLPGVGKLLRSKLPDFLHRPKWVEFVDGFDKATPFKKLIEVLGGLKIASSGQSSAPVSASMEALNPYKALEAFDCDDSGLFFGRATETHFLLRDIDKALRDRTMRLVPIVGASGIGKSSLAKAGLLAKLKDGEVSGSENWRYAELRPGNDPLYVLACEVGKALRLNKDELRSFHNSFCTNNDPHTLCRRLDMSLDGAHLVLLIDQFEELFTLCQDAKHRKVFIENLLSAVKADQGPLIAIFTLRNDFLDKCAEYDGFPEALTDFQTVIGPMKEQELREAIEEPALRIGFTFESGLVDRLLVEATEQAGALPLLQYALYHLWDRHDAKTLTHKAYEDIGGIEGALAKCLTINYIYK